MRRDPPHETVAARGCPQYSSTLSRATPERVGDVEEGRFSKAFRQLDASPVAPVATPSLLSIPVSAQIPAPVLLRL